MPIARRTPTGNPAGCRTHGSGKSVAAAEVGADKVTALAEGLAQCSDLDLQILLSDNDTLPNSAQQLFLRDQCAICFEQDQEQIESARPQLDRDALGKQLTPAQQYLKPVEFERRPGVGDVCLRLTAPDRPALLQRDYW
jgi:hypothetical protein